MAFSRGEEVTHTRTSRRGFCLGESSKHSGWYIVQWHNETTGHYLYTADEIEKIVWKSDSPPPY